MRYRIYFDRTTGQQPIEIDGCRFEFHPKAHRRLRLYRGPARSAEDCIDLFLPAAIRRINDDHGRAVYIAPTEPIVQGLFARLRGRLAP